MRHFFCSDAENIHSLMFHTLYVPPTAAVIVRHKNLWYSFMVETVTWALKINIYPYDSKLALNT